MTDLATEFDNANLRGDLAQDGGVLAQDDSLVTSIILSLFSDRRARTDDILPGGDGDRRGWWGDLVPPVEGDEFGSRLWLLSREKVTPQTLNRAQEYAQEALAWLVADGHALAVEVQTEETRRGVLGLLVVVTLTDGSRLNQRYQVPLTS